MKLCPEKFLASLALIITPLIFVSPTSAAAPDGAGPWADSVLSSSQGLMKNGAAVPAIRSNPSSALGAAENNTTEGNFFSLGFGGNIALGFDNGISSGVILVEATNLPYATEKAKVEVSENGTTWVNAGEVSADGSVNKPESITCAKYVRITDISNPNEFTEGTADGYDVDGVKATGEPCTPPNGGGNNGGGGSGNCDVDIDQKNKTNVSLNINSNVNTGKNKTNDNTGGSNKIKTGDATSNTTVVIAAGSNTATGGCCCGGGDTKVKISNNGAGSTNTVNINSDSKKNKVEKKAKKDK